MCHVNNDSIRSGTKNNALQHILVLNDLIIGELKQAPAYNDKDGTCVAKMIAFGAGEGLSASICVTATKNKIFESAEVGVGGGAFLADFAIADVRMRDSNGILVTSWKDFNDEIKGLSMKVEISGGLTFFKGVTPHGYSFESSGVKSNVSAQATIGFTFEGIDKEKYFRKEW